MRRAYGILFVASLALLMPVIAQIGGRPMTLLVARVSGPVNDPELPPPSPPPFMRDGIRLGTTANGPVNAEMALRGLNIIEDGTVTHAAIYFRFRVIPERDTCTTPADQNRMIRIMADGADANIQNQQFIDVGTLQGGGKGAILVFRARAVHCDNNNPPNRVEQQGDVVILIEDRAPGASQRPDPGARPERVTLIYTEGGGYTYTYIGEVVRGDIYTHLRFIPP